jgi:glycosyltransferase involved in cell wall biosynthesis
LVIVQNHLPPYTRRVYEAFVERHEEDLHVLTCATSEPHRSWEVRAPRNFTHTVLPGLRWDRSDISHVYVNPSLFHHLRRLRPEVLAVGGFAPTMLFGVIYARATGTPYGVQTDGTLNDDPGEASLVHRLMRQQIVPRARFGICGSEATVTLLERWGLGRGRGIRVPIVPAWDAPGHLPAYAERPFDIIFAGGINDKIKGALFFADVLAALAASGLKLRVRVAGKGPQEGELAARLRGAGIDARFDGPLQPAAMAEAFCSAKIMLFPSRQDAWGLVANEAVMCGTPVLASPHATSSSLLVDRFGVGLVRPLEVDVWCAAVRDMLASEERWRSFMARRKEALDYFTVDAAVDGLHRAFELGREGNNKFAKSFAGR